MKVSLKNLLLIFFGIILIGFTIIWLRENFESYKAKLEGKSTIAVNLNKEFTLVKNQTAFIPNEDFRLRLTKITYSPCPKSAVCIWSGLGADFEASKGDKMQKASLAIESNTNNIFFGYEIKIKSVKRANVAFEITKR